MPHQPAISALEVCSSPKRITQLLLAGMEPTISKRGEGYWICFAIGKCSEHPARTEPEEVRNQAGQLDLRLF
jgi:hypothetical protein